MHSQKIFNRRTTQDATKQSGVQSPRLNDLHCKFETLSSLVYTTASLTRLCLNTRHTMTWQFNRDEQQRVDAPVAGSLSPSQWRSSRTRLSVVVVPGDLNYFGHNCLTGQHATTATTMASLDARKLKYRPSNDGFPCDRWLACGWDSSHWLMSELMYPQVSELWSWL